jgi:hypothetical protein
MKSALIFLAISATIATAAPANACDGVSFFRYANGRCVNLTSMTWLGRAEAKQAGLEREDKPFRYKFGPIEQDPNNQFLYTSTVEITNVSENTTLKNGLLRVDGGKDGIRISMAPFTSLRPGQSKKFAVTFFVLDGNDSNFKIEDFSVDYDPTVSRNFGGIQQIRRDRDAALDRSYPYNIKKEVTVCLVDYCPRGMARTDR